MGLRLFSALFLACVVHAQQSIVVRPHEIDSVLANPGIGFTTFQRFNGDDLNRGLTWTEGYPLDYQPFKGSLENHDYPATSIAYFRVYWRFVEPRQGEYRWDLIDKALATARERKQTLMLRIAPYGSKSDNDVPDWFRAMVGKESSLPSPNWRTNPEDPRYINYFTRIVRQFGTRYDGHPDLESVDAAIVGFWGEGGGSALLSEQTRDALANAYLDSFSKTPLVMLLTDAKTNAYALSKRAVGWRADCLGDMGGFRPDFAHMLDVYPEDIINFGVRDAWKKAPVSFEACWVMQKWKNEGWDTDYIIDQSLKWHISSFNAKSSAVPAALQPAVDRWLKKMGYRFVLRKLTVPAQLHANQKLSFTSWWENKGVAPCYKDFRLAIRLKGPAGSAVFLTDADIRSWLPGDNLYDSAIFLPADFPPGQYEFALAIVDFETRRPRVKLAIQGVDADGWYPLTNLIVAP